MHEVKSATLGFEGQGVQWKRGDRDLRKACNDFESLVMHELLKGMRRTVEKCDLFHGGQGEEIYESLLDMELSKKMAGLGPNSLSEMLYRQVSPGNVDAGSWKAAPEPVGRGVQAGQRALQTGNPPADTGDEDDHA